MLLAGMDLHKLVADGVLELGDVSLINAASIDLTLGDTILVESPDPGQECYSSIRPHLKESPEFMEVKLPYAMAPGEFILAHANEKFNLPDDISAEYKLKSSMARCGLEHLFAGWCFPAGTKVPVLEGGTKNIEQMRPGDFVYSLDAEGQVVAGEVIAAKETKRTTKLVEVVLDDGERIACTPDHRFMLRDGSYKEAAELEPGTALMPFYRRVNKMGYEEVYHPSTNLKSNWKDLRGAWGATHRAVLKSAEVDIAPGHVCHHANENKRDNRPSNLTSMLKIEHDRLHCRERNTAPAGRKSAAVNGKNVLDTLWKDPAFRQRKEQQSAEQMTELNAKQWADEGHKAAMLPIQRANAKHLRGVPQDKVQRAAKLGQVKKAIASVLALGLPVNEDTYLRCKPQNAPTLNTLEENFGGFKEACEQAGYANHKVSSVNRITAVDPVPVYDITVDRYHNFALDSGVFVHNCDAGWSGQLTLEFVNATRHHNIVLEPGMKCGQMIFHRHSQVPDDQSYRTKGSYNGSTGVTKADRQ